MLLCYNMAGNRLKVMVLINNTRSWTLLDAQFKTVDHRESLENF